MIDHGCNRLIVRFKVSADHQREFRLAGQIAARGFQFLDDVFAIRDAGELHHAVLVGCGLLNTAVKRAVQTKDCPGQWFAVLIDLFEIDFIGMVDHCGDGLLGTHKRAVNGDGNIHGRCRISGQRRGFHNAVRSEGDFFKNSQSICIGYGGHHGIPAFVDQ